MGLAEVAGVMALIHAMSLRNPWWLLLALQPLLLWLLAVLRQRFQHDDFVEASLLPWVLSPRQLSGSRQYLRQLAMALAWSAFALAMAGPRSVQRIIDTNETQYLTLQVVVDESYSMSARDIVPTRIDRVQLELHDLLDRLQQVRMGLIVYAARAHVMIPPTTDKSVLRHAIESLRVRELPTEGSDMFSALRMARQQLVHARSPQRAILLISDGEVSRDSAQDQKALADLVNTLRQDNIHLYTLGVGTLRGAALLNDQNGWLQHAGRTVVTRLHAARLQMLAQAGNGAYAEVADDDSDWQTLYDDGIAHLETVAREDDAAEHVIWQDLSAWFVLPGVVLLLLAYVRLPSSRSHASITLLLCALLVSGLLHAPSSQAADNSYPAAYALYQAGKYQDAAREFAHLPGYAARMAEAASHYQLQQYPQAAVVYIQAVLDADSDAQRAAALFNLGNSYFKQQAYAQAVNTYRDVLRYQPTLAAAKINLAYAQALQQNPLQDSTAMTDRAGTGQQTARAMPNTDVGKGRVGIDESESKTPLSLPLSIDTSPQRGGDNGLLEQAKPATEKVELDKDVQWTYDITQAKDIQPQETRFAVDESTLWQRLYEAEEDFPAPLARPQVLPGEMPW
jgi:Ca-activated chloride channel family protein